MEQRSAERVTRIVCRGDRIANFGGEDSEEEIDVVDEIDSNNSEFSVSDLESEDGDSGIKDDPYNIYGKDMHEWFRTPPKTQKRKSNVNSPVILPKAIGAAASSTTPLQSWSTLFTQEMLEIILKYTNAEIQRFIAGKGKVNCALFQPVTLNELKAFIGILYFCGFQKKNQVIIPEIWSSNFGLTLCKSTMSEQRFEFISCRLRFDHKATRAARRTTDVLAPIREIWDIFIKNCQNNYSPSEFLTIDEQLLEFYGRFSARVFTKSKPARHGIKIVSMNDAETFYMYNAIPHIGNVPAEQGETVPSYYIRKLSEPIRNTNRNITCNDKFTSVEICNRMKQEFNLSLVGKLRKNKRQIPNSFKRNASMGTAKYCYDGQNTLLSYCPKKNKVVLLLSSMHQKGKASKENGRPEMIELYNKTKRGTDTFNQLCEKYSCARTSKRWTMRFFLGMLDQACVNSCILYNLPAENLYRNQREFMKELACFLIEPHLQERTKKPKSNGMQETFPSDYINDSMVGTNKLPKRKRCFFCTIDYDRKTQLCCLKCKKPICEEHRIVRCTNCLI